MTRLQLAAASLAALLVGAMAPVSAQPAADPFASEAARVLYEAAVHGRERLDDSVLRYTAAVRERMSAGLRMPLKDRTLFRSESAARVRWWRDGRTLVQVLALRKQTPAGVDENAVRPEFADAAFDPLNDRLVFGFASTEDMEDESDPDDYWFEHPLVPRYREHYRFAVGDSLTLTLPDERRIRAVELQVVPTAADVHRMSGSLWIEPGTGALVRAVFRLSDTFDAMRDTDLREEEDDDLKHVPAILKPMTFDLSMVAVEYALWDSLVWLPRSLRAEGVAAAGILRAPAAWEVTYEMEEVVTAGSPESEEAGEDDSLWHLRDLGALGSDSTGIGWVPDPGWTRQRDARGRRIVRYLVPADPATLATSPDLPPPIWEDAPGVTDVDELEAFARSLDALPEAERADGTPATFRWGWQRTDLLRYNRVEGLSVGARGQIYPETPVGRLSLTATARLGSTDLEPNGRLDVTRENLRRRVTLSAYHELAAVDDGARHLGLGNSVTALLFGRDDGDYYRRSGGALEWTPPASERASFRVRAYAERHRPVSAGADFALRHLGDGGWKFRPNLAADEGWDAGGELTLAPWWGSDPREPQAGLELATRVGAGTWSYRTASLEGRVAVPLPVGFRVALESAGGTSWGAPPAQRTFLVGGASTLRGYEPATLRGGSFARGRGELARQFSFGAVSLFSDAAWAGERADFEVDDALWSAGVGLSLVDGLIRADAAWGLSAPRGFRFELYLDGIL